ncbi:hypothetical protein PIB30_099401, partial [Stylosanthes scabra]|nr:hypothetical protein [Stylosanthes scabra]
MEVGILKKKDIAKGVPAILDYGDHVCYWYGGGRGGGGDDSNSSGKDFNDCELLIQKKNP